MKQRIITGVLFAAALVVTFLLRAWLLLPVMEIVCLLCCHELLSTFYHKGFRPARGLTFACAAVPLPVMWFFGPQAALAATLAALFALLLCHLFRKEPSLPDTAAALFSAAYVSVPLSLLVALMHVQPEGLGALLLAASFLFAYAGDVLAYFAGSLFGKHKMTPVLSPKKTWEGAAGGLAGSLLVGAALWAAGRLSGMYLPVWHCLPLALAAGAAAQAGDLTASLVKRYCGVKDYGNLFPGHGGMMDRIDSVLFTSIVVFVYCLLAGVL